ncbi:hypothetical protein [Roseovarius salinarum]|uniref:hypothetical protein n=1 Tax=Roseovarius salinarum TaxID=1981892 RepID=UPI000C349AE0|nr:hypothetical protein [Roseovarius salinarum]
MALTVFKAATGRSTDAATDIRDTVSVMPARLRSGGGQVALDYARPALARATSVRGRAEGMGVICWAPRFALHRSMTAQTG